MAQSSPFVAAADQPGPGGGAGQDGHPFAGSAPPGGMAQSPPGLEGHASATQWSPARQRAYMGALPALPEIRVVTEQWDHQAIIRELNRSLDPEKAGELGEHLVNLYDYFDTRLQEANVQKNKEIIEEIRTRLTELRDAWNESINQLNEAPAPSASLTQWPKSPSIQSCPQ